MADWQPPTSGARRRTRRVLDLVRAAMLPWVDLDDAARRLRALASDDDVLLKLALGRVSRALLRVPSPAGMRAAEVLRRALRLGVGPGK